MKQEEKNKYGTGIVNNNKYYFKIVNDISYIEDKEYLKNMIKLI